MQRWFRNLRTTVTMLSKVLDGMVDVGVVSVLQVMAPGSLL